MLLHVSSTMCSSSGGKNCIIQHLAGIITPVGGRPVHRMREAYNKLIIKEEFVH